MQHSFGSVTEPIFTPEQLAEIQAYHWPHYVWGAIGDPINLVVAVLLLRFVVRPLYALCAKLPGGIWGPTLGFALAYYAVTSLLYLPVDVWFDYVLEHRYGLSNDTPAMFAIDTLKGHAMYALGLSALAVGMFGLARRLKRWWLPLGVVGASALLLSAALDPYRARVFYSQTPLPQGELRDRITELMTKAHIDFRDVLVEGTSRSTVRLGAYFAGTGPTRTIVLNDSLVHDLTTDEIVAAVAHEAGHVHESRWPGTIASALALILFPCSESTSSCSSSPVAAGGASSSPPTSGRCRFIMLVFSLTNTVVRPVSAAFSRARESEADVYGLRLTQDPDAFRSMLIKCTRVNKMDPDPPRWAELKAMSHPSIRERLDAIDRQDWKKTSGE